MTDNPLKVGIFICECGGNIGDVVDVKSILEEAKSWKGVVDAKYQKYLCSRPSQEVIINAIKKIMKRLKEDR